MDLPGLFAKQKELFRSGITLDCRWRKETLELLGRCIVQHEKQLLDALYKDMGKPAGEAYTSEIGPVLEDIHLALRNLGRWSKPEKVSSPLLSFPARSRYYPRPYGSVLIIGPWNYPLGLLVQPLVSALAAGNCAVLKPSENAPASGLALFDMIDRFFSPDTVAVVCADAIETGQAIESGGPDYVFFTGGSASGKRVMASCARELIPCALELGGRNPCIVDTGIPVHTAAARIVWGKFFNAGQTCVAPNVCYVHQNVYPLIVTALVNKVHSFYGTDLQASDSCARIVNETHFHRLEKLFTSSRCVVVAGGGRELKNLYWSPTVVTCSSDDPILREEVFGPILPVVPYADLNNLLNCLRMHPSPLIVYLYTARKSTISAVRSKTVSGSLCINASLHMIANSLLPFGGTGKSGMGRYHGKAGFLTFSYIRSEMEKRFFPESGYMYPPYRTSFWIVKRVIRLLLRQ